MCRCNVRDRTSALQTFAALDTNTDGRIDLQEFVDATAASLSGESETAVVAKLSDMLEQRFAGRFHWDLSRARCGARGVLPLLRVLQRDAACESLDASGCGLDNDAVLALVRALHSHPVRPGCSSCRLSMILWKSKGEGFCNTSAPEDLCGA